MKKILVSITLLLITATIANAQLHLFEFFSTADALNSNSATGATVSGSAVIDEGASTVKFTFNNLSGSPKPGGGNYNPGDLVEFGFWNAPDGVVANEFNWVDPSAKTLDSGGSWTDSTLLTNIWGSGEAYYGSAADNRGDNKDGIWDGQSGMFTFTLDGSFNLGDLAAAWTSNTNDTKDSLSDLRFKMQTTTGGGSDKMFVDLRAVPEPSTYGIIGASALILLVAARRFKKK